LLLNYATLDSLSYYSTSTDISQEISDSIGAYTFFSAGTDGQVPYMNSAGTDFLYTGFFTFNNGRLVMQNEYNNILIGQGTMGNEEAGGYNTIIGVDAGYGNEGDFNVIIGEDAARYLENSNAATIVGSRAFGASSIISSDSSTAVGFKAGYNSSGYGHVFLGNGAGTNITGNNKLAITNTSDPTPIIYGDFATDELTFNVDTTHNKGHLVVDSNLYVNKYAQISDSVVLDNHFIRWNESDGTFEFGMGNNNVVWQGALEDLVQVYNNSGADIDNFDPVYLSGSNGDSIITIALSDCRVHETTDNFAGLATMDIPNNSWGYVAVRGEVRHGNTSTLSTTSSIYLGEGVLQNTKPAYPCRVLNIGKCIKVDATEGIVYVNVTYEEARLVESMDYNFTSQGIGVGQFYRAGFYRANATSATLTNASTTVTYGTANVGYAAHFFIVCGGAGTVNSGTVGLRMTGTSVDDEGNIIVSDADTVLTDITTTSLNAYFEGKKFNGIVTFELITTSGSPTTYSLTFNYGYAKYDDSGNRNFYITGIEAVGLAGAASTDFDMTLFKHSTAGWTYAASGFVPGGTVLAKRSVDMGTKDNLANALPFAWKRTDLSEYVHGANGDGFIIRITTGANNAVQSMDIHVRTAIDR